MNHDADESVLRRPIIVLGAPRSGTTFLGRVLSRHRDLAYLVEPRLIWKYGNDCRSDLLRPEHATPFVRAGVRRKFARTIRAQGKQRLLEKTPSNSLRPGFVDAIFPDCLFVNIIRSGLDSVLSIESFWQEHAQGVKTVVKGRLTQRLRELEPWRLPLYAPEFARRMAPRWLRWLTGRNEWGPRLPGIRAMAKEMTDLEVAALQWRTCVEQACRFGRSLPPERYFECRLEDLSVDVAREIVTFCGLPPSDEVESDLNTRFDRSRASSRSRAVDPERREEVLRWIAPTMQWLGYGAN